MSVTIVSGPPCSGKSTYVAAHLERGDTVLDFDELYVELSGDPIYVQRSKLRPVVNDEFRRRLEKIRQGWIIRNAPLKQHRATLARIHRAQVVVLAVPADVCLERLMASDRPERVKVEQAEAIHRWWDQYEPWSEDTLLVL